MRTYKLRIILGTAYDNDDVVEGCVIGRSWGNQEQALKFARQHLSGYKVQLVVSITNEIKE